MNEAQIFIHTESVCLNVESGTLIYLLSLVNVLFGVKIGAIVKVKPLILRHPEQVLARPVGLMRRFQMEQFRALLRMEENPEGKTTSHWL